MRIPAVSQSSNFFKQKTAYEISTRDWSSDVCSSDLSRSLRFLLLQWIVALSLWKVVSCEYICYSNDGTLVILNGSMFVEIFVTPMDGTLVIMKGSLLSRIFLLHWMVALSLWKVVYCRDISYSNGL